MSNPKASTDGAYLIDFGLFPREIRDAIYRECVVVEGPINLMSSYRGPTPLMDHDKQIRETVGVLDGSKRLRKFTDEAREVYLAENMFILPCWELPNFLGCRYMDSYDIDLDATPFVRSLCVTIYYEVGERDVVWFFNQSPDLRRLLECPHLQNLELSICGPGGPAADSETMRKVMKIMDVCVQLWKKLGWGMKTFLYDCIQSDEEATDEDENSSETDSNDQSSGKAGEHSGDLREDGDCIYYGPGEDTPEDGHYYRFRKMDASEIWQKFIEHSKELGKNYTSSTHAS